MLKNSIETDRELKRWLKFKNKWSIILLIILIIIFLQEVYVPIGVHLISKYYLNDKVIEFANSYISNLSNNECKLKALLEWENNNYNPIYGYKHDIPFLPYLFYNELNFRLCIRTDKDNDPSWVFLSKCRACGESALLYSQLVRGINLNLRVIKNPGEDHVWTEVLVNNSWIIIDPSSNTFNLSKDYFIEHKNLSYIYALYENGTKLDLTKKYTNKTGIIILKMDSRLKNRRINLISRSIGNFHETEVECKWNNDICRLEVGSTNYTLIAHTGGIIKYYDKKEFYLEENEIFEIDLNPNKIYLSHIVKSKSYAIARILLFILVMWGIVGFIISAFKKRNR